MTTTPNPLPGNQFANDAVAVAEAFTDSPTTTLEVLLYDVRTALLALAFEQRTATLAALLDSGALSADYTQVAGQVRTRLGLGGDDA